MGVFFPAMPGIIVHHQTVLVKYISGVMITSIFGHECLSNSMNVINTLAPGWFRRFLQKKRLNARGFAREFLRSGMLYRLGESLKRHGKSSSLHSKTNFLLGGVGFL